jgi:ribosomal-protein-alanine N-acetyltransferase
LDALWPPVLIGEQVLLRGWTPEDAGALRDACGDFDICRFTTVPETYTTEAAQAWITRQQARAHKGTAVVWAIVPNDGDEPVGMVGLFGLGEQKPEARFGYWLVAARRREGLASAATALAAQWGFAELGLREIHIDRESANRASAAVAAGLGAPIAGPHVRSFNGATVELIRHTLKAP